MMNVKVKYENKDKNRMVYTLIYINNHVSKSICCILSNNKDIFLMNDYVLILVYESLAKRSLNVINWI